MNQISREEVKVIVDNAELRFAAQMARLDTIAENLTRETADLKTEMRAVRQIVVGGVLTILFGIAGVNYALLNSFQGGFDAGARAQAEHEAMRQDIHRVAEKLEALDKRLERIELNLPQLPKK